MWLVAEKHPNKVEHKAMMSWNSADYSGAADSLYGNRLSINVQH